MNRRGLPAGRSPASHRGGEAGTGGTNGPQEFWLCIGWRSRSEQSSALKQPEREEQTASENFVSGEAEANSDEK